MRLPCLIVLAHDSVKPEVTKVVLGGMAGNPG